MSKEGQTIFNDNFSFKDRLNLVTIVCIIYAALLYLGNFNASLFITDIISILITIYIWYSDGILKIDIKYKYVIYYSLILIFSLRLLPRDILDVFTILYKNGFREEVIFRLFFVGIFYIYYKENNIQKDFLNIILLSNGIFAFFHTQYTGILKIGIFVIGLMFTAIYIKGGIFSSILAHTIYNLYLGNESYFIKVLTFIPIVFIVPDIKNLMNNMTKKIEM